MTRFALAIVLLCVALERSYAHDQSADSAVTGCARYLGNEGVLVSSGDTKVLFDAFYANSYNRYALVPEHIETAMIEGRPPYDGIDALFVSHVHGDHFSPQPTIRFLRQQQHVRLYGSKQTAAALLEAGAGQAIMDRVTTFDLDATDAAVSESVGDLLVNVIALPHSGGERMAHIQNLSFRVTLDKTVSVVHLGDAGAVEENFARHAGHWRDQSLHAAFPPYWLFDGATGKAIVRDYLKAQHVVGVHVPASAAGRGASLRLETGFDLFTDPGEMRKLGHSHSKECEPVSDGATQEAN